MKGTLFQHKLNEVLSGQLLDPSYFESLGSRCLTLCQDTRDDELEEDTSEIEAVYFWNRN